jgi:hypothetical protein
VGGKGHEWLESDPRRLQISPGLSVLHRHCARCGRDLLEDLTSRNRYAVIASAVSFYRLADEVTERWLREPCPGRYLSTDREDRTKKVAELFVCEDPRLRDSAQKLAERRKVARKKV